jgi:cell wall-associated NlpC family hydrolase
MPNSSICSIFKKKVVMNFGIVPIAFTPVRSDPSEQAGQITQLLFGELCSIQDQKKNWFHVRAAYDNYEGWIDQKMVSLIEETTYQELLRSEPLIIADPFLSVTQYETGLRLVIPSGSAAWHFREKDNSFTNGYIQYRFDQNPSRHDATSLSKTIADTAAAFINTPYLWGGKSTFGCDCSGLVQTLFRIYGTVLPRDAAKQVNSGETVSFLNDARPGDIAFFDNEEGEIIHVGILLDNKRILHASGRVRMDNIDQEGIFNRELGKYTHKLRTIKRIMDQGEY